MLTKLMMCLSILGAFSQLAFADGFGNPVPGNGGSVCGTNSNPCPDLDQHLPTISAVSSVVCSSSGLLLSVNVRSHAGTLKFNGATSTLQTELVSAIDSNGTTNYELSGRNAATRVEVNEFKSAGTATVSVAQGRSSFFSADVACVVQ